MLDFNSILQAGGQMLGFGQEDEEEKVKNDRMRRYREAMQRAQGYSAPSSTAGIQSQMAALQQAGGAHLQGAANQAMSAIQDENQSRVAQLREMRRMEHEKELMRMRAAAQEKEAEGDIIRSLLNGR